MARKKKAPRKIGVIDFETDPFLYGRVPEVFAGAFYDGIIYREFWGKDAAEQLISFLRTLEDEYFIFAHNGGKFDFFFMFDYLENPLKIINGRIIQAGLGKHILRDSFAILPVALATYKKDDIDYSLFEADKRDANKADILHYLAKDCEYLLELVLPFIDEFGPRLTIGGTAIKELTKFHPVAKQGESHDEQFRPFYYGGRCEAIERGIIEDDLKVYDVNSMYPYCMSQKVHPCGKFYAKSSRGISASGKAIGFGERPYFAKIVANNRGALPMRIKENGIAALSFRVPFGEFNATSHEIQTALKFGLIKIHQVKELYIPAKTISFDEFVETFFSKRLKAKAAGDKAHDIFYKLILNSAYGRFAIDPEKFYDWWIGYSYEDIPEGYTPFEKHGDLWICRKKAIIGPQSYHDVAVAASITGAARATLLEALAGADRPVYCDTDSIIARSISAEKDSKKLGAWKLEDELVRIAIAGKKLYAGFDADGNCVKQASKGVRLAPEEIVKVCGGAVINWSNPAPSFSLSHETNFVSRNVAMKK